MQIAVLGGTGGIGGHVLSGPERRTLFICTAEWRMADGAPANLERLSTGPRTGEILALPVQVPGTGQP